MARGGHSGSARSRGECTISTGWTGESPHHQIFSSLDRPTTRSHHTSPPYQLIIRPLHRPGPEPSPPHLNRWALYKDLDEDQSGLITFDEFLIGARERLRIRPGELSDIQAAALWCVLDADNSGYMESGEFHTFMGRVDDTHAGKDEARRKLLEQKAIQARQLREGLSARELELEGFVGEYKTDMIKEDLKKAGVALIEDDAEKKKIANQFKAWVRAYMPDRQDDIAWLLVFKEVDNDASGLVTYDELRQVIRRKFKLPASKVSEEQVKRIWVMLDADGSDTIAQVEMAKFMKLADKDTGKGRGRGFSHMDSRGARIQYENKHALPPVKRPSSVAGVTARPLSPLFIGGPGTPRPVTSRRPRWDPPKDKWLPPSAWNKRVWAPTTLETNYLGGPWVPVARPRSPPNGRFTPASPRSPRRFDPNFSPHRSRADTY